MYYVTNGLDSCQALNWSMGSSDTIDQYCGADPNLDIIHDKNDIKVHFPGCGYTEDKCTKRPCCSDAARYELNSTTCSDTIKTYEFYDPVTSTYKDMEISCFDHFMACFRYNSMMQGQCCQCKVGWTGIDCNTAVCYPNR